MLKTMLFIVDGPEGPEPLAIALPGDREVDMKRLEAHVQPGVPRPFGEADFAGFPALVKGYLGPQVLGVRSSTQIRLLLDPRVGPGTAWVAGANQYGHHVYDLVIGRDVAGDGIIDVAEVKAGDDCPSCGAAIEIARGIEIGHIFQLGRKYAEALDLRVLNEAGERVTVTMGSYGIGVSRAVAAIAEQHHDERGLVWPREVAPADVHIVAAGKDDEIYAVAERLAGDLTNASLRVLIDDRRSVSPGVKFADSELIGVPTIVVVGKRLTDGVIEVKDRRTGERQDIPVADAVAWLVATTSVR